MAGAIACETATTTRRIQRVSGALGRSNGGNIMKRIGIISISALFLIVGLTAPAYAQQDDHKDQGKPTQDQQAKPEEQHQQTEQAKPAPEQQAKPQEQQHDQQAQQPKPVKQENTQPEHTQQAQQPKPQQQQQAQQAKQPKPSQQQ